MGTPLTKQAVADLYFLEHRAKVLDLAAFLDRFDRAGEPGGSDFRVEALKAALGLVLDGQPDRAKRVLELWSDRSMEPIDRAPMKGALGAMPIDAKEHR
ncbi:MAG: hypothetical protein RL527_327 [Planctomycetota bacterium]|jgi:hypothetical protein